MRTSRGEGGREEPKSALSQRSIEVAAKQTGRQAAKSSVIWESAKMAHTHTQRGDTHTQMLTDSAPEVAAISPNTPPHTTHMSKKIRENIYTYVKKDNLVTLNFPYPFRDLYSTFDRWLLYDIVVKLSNSCKKHAKDWFLANRSYWQLCEIVIRYGRYRQCVLPI